MKTETTKSTKGTGLFKAFLCLLCFLWLRPPFVQAQATLDQVFVKMDEVAKTFHSVQTDFERTKVTVLVNDKDVATGKFYYERQGKVPRLKMELSKPAVQFLLIDKGQVQLYEPNVKQLKKGSLEGHQDQVEVYMSLGFGQSSQELKKNFNVSLIGDETVDGKKTTVIELKSKTPSAYKSVRMWIDQQSWISYQIKITENTNDYSVLKYSNAKLGASISGSVFELPKMPKDVSIIKF